MKPSEALEKHRETIREILSRYPVSNPRVFGSVARGEDTEESDLDILVDLKRKSEREASFTLFDLARIELSLEELLGVGVDIRLDSSERTRFGKRIARGAQPL
ncbi:nucleotidyltransferase family protein [Fulvimarina sp. MAC8]|uniref:nucleotidyltransferase family protein n=1 Tax=Fulvimarina sp. MAC8 TaxID=3162874 RepID=UPI0032ECF3E8